MTFRQFVKYLLDRKLLSLHLVVLPDNGLRHAELSAVQERLGAALDAKLVEFLQTWDGADLDVLRILSSERLHNSPLGVCFASDPAGFCYYLSQSGIVQEDTDGGTTAIVAKDFEDFLFGFVFGERSTEFLGKEWLEQLQAAGVAS